jgi:hypothetical protein
MEGEHATIAPPKVLAATPAAYNPCFSRNHSGYISIR